MTYQVIARKWRPQVFEEVTGQEVITQTLRNALQFDRLHHAYLFSGARGVGKTTTARILAKALNCRKTDAEPNLTPCRVDQSDACPSCIEISESRSMDVLEIDAASHTGIDDVRGTIIDGINFNPARDRYKVFIIDEVHQLSRSAFNALLKTLEEPPPKVVFVMATTELHKVPETILSRCQEFEFRTIPTSKIRERLALIAESEGVQISQTALTEIARSGEGSMRDAQSNFDQVISFSGESISEDDVTKALGIASATTLRDMLAAIAAHDPRSVLTVADDLIGRGHDLRNFCRDLLSLIRDLVVTKVSGGDTALLDGTTFTADDLSDMAEGFSESDLLRMFNSVCQTEASLRDAVHPRYVLELGLVKLIEIRKVASLESILARLGTTIAGLPTGEPASAQLEGAGVETTPEKKTLEADLEAPNLDISLVEREWAPETDASFSHLIEAPERDFDANAFSISEPVDSVPLASTPLSSAYQPAVAIRLPSLTSDDLRHFDDKKLDESYEEKLIITGDHLVKLEGIDQLLRQFSVAELPIPKRELPGSVQLAMGAAAVNGAKMKAEFIPDEEEIELPELTESPTEEELAAYARAHPTVRAALRVFRAKIVEVRKV